MQRRRDFLRQIAWTAAAFPALAARSTGTIGLAMGNHGFKAFSAEEAIKIIAGIGYDGVEFCMLPDYATEPAKASPETRRAIRSLLNDYQLALPTLFERIPILGDANEHRAHLERIRRDAQFGHDVNAGVGGVKPVIESHLSGDSKDWEAKKHLIVERLREWAEVAGGMQTVFAIKGHNLNLADSSDKILWLTQQVNSPWLRVEFDYSHYQAGGEALGAALDRLLPYTVVVTLQDTKLYTNKPGFERLLPGDGTVDYMDYYRRLLKFGYTGFTICWVGEAFLTKPNYDAIAAAKHCYANIAPVMEKAGVPRPVRSK
jgi:sugar phosphate isomerase/epimerase